MQHAKYKHAMQLHLSVDRLKALSNLTLSTSNHGVSTTSLGNLLQCLTTLIIKNFVEIHSLGDVTASDPGTYHWRKSRISQAKYWDLPVGDMGLMSKELVTDLAGGTLEATPLLKCTGMASKIWQTRRN